MLIRFWGTRGSIPVALTGAGVRSKIKQALLQANGRCFDDNATVERFIDEELDFPIRHSYGGNTACVDIVGGTEYMVCDMGSGLRSLGQQIMREHGPGKPQVYNFFMSHVHWDHLMGFPFFPPAYIPGNTIRIQGALPFGSCRRLFTDSSPTPASQWIGRIWARTFNWSIWSPGSGMTSMIFGSKPNYSPIMAIRMGIVSKRTPRSLSIRRLANISWNRRGPPQAW